MKKRSKSLAVVALLMLFGYYGWLLFVQFFYDLNLNAQGRAIAAATRVAFGQTSYFSDYKKVSDSVREKITSECASKNIESNPPYHCLVAQAFANQKSYLRECGWWRFENCAQITLDPVLLKFSESKELFDRVLSEPCKYLPNDDALASARLEERKVKAEKADPSLSRLTEYSHARRDLGCEKPTTESLKIIIDGLDTEKSIIFIQK